MSKYAALGMATDKVRITVEDGADGLVVRFGGQIDAADPGEFLDPVLADIHAEIVKAGLGSVDANFTELAFLNSSGIKCLIRWIMRQTELEEARRYRIRFLYSSRVTWQQTSLKALTYLAPETVVAVPV